MAHKLVTCPETAHLERIEYEDHPLGILITGCTQLEPGCDVGCQRTCAARLDVRYRMSDEFDEQPTLADASVTAGV